MFSYFLFGLSLASAIGLLAAGLTQHRLAPVPDANAGECCVYKGPDQRCLPCRPTRGAR
jgi:hypothetical protein